MPGQHAKLSPSSAHRWMNCPAAPRLEAAAPDRETEFTLEGTLAHAYCAKKLKEHMGLPTDKEQREIADLAETFHTGEMDEHTDTYKAIVLEKYLAAKKTTRDAQLLIETRLDFSDYVPEAYGTSDATIIADGLMEVIDFKYGKGVRVESKDNPQMLIYALGAYSAHSFEYRIDRVRMTIVQPRLENISEWEVSAADLQEWADTVLRPKAEEAARPDAEQRPGEWCQFCKVRCSCRALADQCLHVAGDCADPALLTTQEMAANILPRLSIIKAWCGAVEEHALRQALDGTSYPGYKLVEGRSARKVTDPGAVAAILAKEGYRECEYMKPPALCGISDLERLVGKKRLGELCSGYIDKPQGKPALVPESDKRKAYNTAADDFEGFK